MERICVGIHVYEQPAQLLATIGSLRQNTNPLLDLMLLPDGPDASTLQAIGPHGDIAQFPTREPLGAAACFNRLAANSDADIVVFLESGVQVAPFWLDRLLEALNADPRNGLAGPSTNLSWNEQCVFPASGSTPDELDQAAQAAALRFRSEYRSLEPLHSLADFCYAVRREVIDAIGGADEAYGLGPCWEMDYNIRAARAGFRGVWAASAYVYRSPFTERRKVEESRRFEAAKRLYQDKFCGARLRGVKHDYRTHCRGDDCPDFAPAILITLHNPLARRGIACTDRLPVFDEAPNSEAAHCSQPPPQSKSGEPRIALIPDHHPTAAVRSLVAEPVEVLVSCIMPTCDRPGFVPRAIDYFSRQDYPSRELIIVDDGASPMGECIPDDDRIRYVRLDRKLTVGAKRNMACELARGELIVHWDDDDWYPSWRISAQVKALLTGEAELCGTSSLLYYKPSTGEAWQYKYSVPASAWVGGNTLAYRKAFWQKNRFHDIQVGEDSRFVFEGPPRNIVDLDDRKLCVAMVHEHNISPKETGGVFWSRQPASAVHQLLGEDLPFYQAMFDPPSFPLVSCIMPTRNRRAFVPLAVKLFLAQNYPNKELIVVDDGDDKVAGLVDGLPGVAYLDVRRATIGAKRNLASARANGEIIAHWDDDDWYGPNRLRYQVMAILREEADITGLENAFVLELPDGQFWTTTDQLHKRMFVGDVHGGTLVYRRSLLAEGLRYPEINLAEDAHLLHAAIQRGKRLLKLPNPGLFVYMRHGSNAWRECRPGVFMDPSGWRRTSRPPTFSGTVLADYRSAAAQMR